MNIRLASILSLGLLLFTAAGLSRAAAEEDRPPWAAPRLEKAVSIRDGRTGELLSLDELLDDLAEVDAAQMRSPRRQVRDLEDQMTLQWQPGLDGSEPSVVDKSQTLAASELPSRDELEVTLAPGQKRLVLACDPQGMTPRCSSRSQRILFSLRRPTYKPLTNTGQVGRALLPVRWFC